MNPENNGKAGNERQWKADRITDLLLDLPGPFGANLAESNQTIDTQGSFMIDGGQFARAPPIDDGRARHSRQFSITQIYQDVLASRETPLSSG